MISNFNLKAKQLLEKISNTSKLIIVGMLSLLTICLVISALPINLVHNVIYGGKIIATVDDANIYYNALELASDKVSGNENKDVFYNPEFESVLTLSQETTGVVDLAQIILDNTDTVVLASELSVNGNVVAVTDDFEKLQSTLDAAKQKYSSGMTGEKQEFVDNVSISEQYYNVESLSAESDFTKKINDLSVKTIVSVTTDNAIKFDTQRMTTTNLSVGKTLVQNEGTDGVERITEQVEFLNGVETSRSVIKDEVLSSAVNKVVLIGVGNAIRGKTTQKASSSYAFIVPVSLSETYVSSYWGDGRGHKGLDFAGPKGTEIYAAAGGTIESVTSTSAYGKYVIVNHGNGIKTLYAHCSSISVNVGDKVVAGQTIANIGKTGNATGNHLHFEIILNGERTDPAPYLGLD